VSRTKKISYARRQVVFARDGYKCCYCGKVASDFAVKTLGVKKRLCVIPRDENGEFEIDHIVPYVETQDNSINNLATSCWKCNNSKRDKRWDIPRNFPYMKLDFGGEI